MEINYCRLCKSKNLKKFLDLGIHPPSDAFLSKDDLAKEELKFPLDVYLCADCGQAQLGYVVPPDLLFCKNYPYESSITRTGKEHFFELAKTVSEYFKLKPDSLVIDMGSNVGVLLAGFKEQGVRILGVDPARVMADIANSNGITTIADFFSHNLAKEILRKYGNVSVITATNVFAHVNDLDDIMDGVSTLLTENGAMVIEAPHFLNLINSTEYDTIYHEHLSYLSVKPLIPFFKKFGMEVINVEERKIHGGTIRIYVARQGKYPVSETVASIVKKEENSGIFAMDRLGKFASEVQEQKDSLLKLLGDLKKDGKRIVGVSAPAKGNTLLNYCGITTEYLDYITEKAQMKVGLYTPGTHIPIYHDDKLLQDQPDYALILAWNFAEEIMNNLSEFKNRGGKFIIPIPKPKII
ncbi:MAG: class I SAM-dependent methyltransferase [Patescibacteria group bacterium]